MKVSDLNGEVHATRVDNLWAIPVGIAHDFHPEQIATADMSRILDLARNDFDTIVVDTGPILGSLEANVVAPMSDRVVLVVSRGQQAKLVRSAIDRLTRLGAVCGGLVFNRAESYDFDRSISTVSLSARSVRDQGARRTAAAGAGALALLEAVGTSGRDHPGT
jgi:polysaccharide biosynthesis transport protein